jgi:hypothetical protein
MTSSRHGLAIATEQLFWKMKLAHPMESLWTIASLHNVAVLEELCSMRDNSGLIAFETASFLLPVAIVSRSFGFQSSFAYLFL